jgi:tripartite-type tricarboxylate transporter receptor subunit TctC
MRIWVAISLLFVVTAASGQPYPAKPVRLLVGFTAGGVVDTTARLLAQRLSDALGQSVIVENRPGASGAIAAERVATSPPDGYTLLLISATDSALPALNPKLPYDIERDFAAVSAVASGTFVLVVHPSVPARTVSELVSVARAQPGKLNYSSPGAGTSSYLAAESFNLAARTKIVHVPYKGGSDSIVAVAAGQIDLSFPSIPALRPYLASARLRPLAVTSAKRAAAIPTLPTIAESGFPGFDRSSWYGVVAPSAVPKSVLSQLNAAIGRALQAPELVEALNRQGLEPQPGSSETFASFVHAQIAENSKLIRAIGAGAN